MAKLDLPITLKRHPVVLQEQQRRAADIQLRIADWITAFAGSMNFVYLHVALFAIWMLFIEKKPVADADADRVAGGDLPVHVRHDRPEPAGGIPAGQGGSRLQRAGA